MDFIKKNKKIITIILIACIVIGFAIFFFIKNKEDEDSSSQETTTSSTEPNPTTVDPSKSSDPTNPSEEGIIPSEENNGDVEVMPYPGDDFFRDPYLPTPEPVTDPPYEGDNYGMSDAYDDGHNHALIRADDPDKAPPETTANLAVLDMFTVDMSQGGYRESIEEVLNRVGTEKAKREGFRPWWVSENEHTAAWNMYAASGTQLITAAKYDGKKIINNDTIMYRYELIPRLVGDSTDTKLPNSGVDIYMKQVGKGWRVDAYRIDPERLPKLR